MVWADSDTSGVDELRGGTDEPGRHDRPERHVPEASGDSGAARACIEPRSRAEYAAAAASGWLPEVQRVFAALDQGGGHGHIRHEGWVTEEMNHRRVAYLEDPAQPDPVKRAAGIDGLRPGDQPHRCRQTAGTTAEVMGTRCSPCVRDRQTKVTREGL